MSRVYLEDLEEPIDMAIVWETIIKVLRPDKEEKEASICKPKQQVEKLKAESSL